MNPRWSLSRNGADFSQASVTMTVDGQSESLVQNAVANGYGLNTLVWEPQGVSVAAGAPDKPVQVTVSNIRVNGVPIQHSYTVTMIDPHATTAPSPVSWEANNTFDQAAVIGQGDVPIAGLTLHGGGNQDYYSWTATASSPVALFLTITQSQSPVTLAVYSASQQLFSSTKTLSELAGEHQVHANPDQLVKAAAAGERRPGLRGAGRRRTARSPGSSGGTSPAGWQAARGARLAQTKAAQFDR